LNVLALCAGVGGLELGIKLSNPAARVVCYVEGETYAAAVLAARMEEGNLDPAPIWSDVESFDAVPWCGKVDLVTAGFPCQPFSVAGKRERENDDRHIWPSIARIVSECEPAFVFLENVAIRAYVEPWRNLRRLGFSLSRPFACTAAELGAGHSRRRVFVLAYRDRDSLRIVEQWGSSGRSGGICDEGETESQQVVSDSHNQQQLFLSRNEVEGQSGKIGIGAADTTDRDSGSVGRREGRAGETPKGNGTTDPGMRWWASEPALERVVHGAPNRMDRDRAIGNGVVPAMAAFAFGRLIREVVDHE